jgi:hypothetical protein
MRIKELINTINLIQKIKKCEVSKIEINILFEQDLMLYANERIKYHLTDFEDLIEKISISSNSIKIKLWK